MPRRKIWLLATCLAITSQTLPATLSRAQTPATPEAPDEARERKVMERFLAVLEKTPRRGTALDRVYGFHVERGSLDPFLKTYRDKILADPNDGSSWLLVGLVEAQRGRDSAAVEALRKAETTRPDDPLPAYYLGQALVLVGQPDAAAEAFERALTRKPARADLLDVYQALGRVHQRAHRNDKALAVWDRLEKAFPDDPRVQEQIAHALADESQDVAALARFEALAKGTKDRFRRVQFAIEAAGLKVRLGRSTEALADFESLLGQLDAESWLGREVRRKVEEVFLRTDDLAGLAAYYESWIKKSPDDVEARARLGRTLAGQGRTAEARKWLDEAVKLAPSRRELRLALIEQLAQERKFAEAAAQYEALAKLEPNNPDVVRDWGRMLLRDTSKPEPERKRAAADVWRRLAPDDAKDAVAVAQAADLFRQAGLADEAIGLYVRAIKLAPDSAQYREYLGEYYHALKRPTNALATWRASAEGTSKNSKTLGRLGEVLAGFGYREEAVGPLTEAIQLEPDDFDLRLKLADLKLALDRPLEALPELDKAETLAAAEEQTEAVLERLIHAYQASGTLANRIERLEKSLVTAPTAAGWTRLARLLEAEQKSTEAARAIGEATRLDPKSISAWVATARLREAAGDLLGAADALRTLTKLDRRSRTDYLTGIAKLEARLGRRGPALEAGRELLAAAPGNPENHQFFAELCFQLGEPDEGLDALRRSARANPADPKATLTLAENLARQFRAEEAIELYWRAFARTTDLEGKLSIVGRMADQYLQRNQLDRLIGRLERELREPNQRRELSLCLAQAHATAGDFGTARQELERLLATDARDSALLTQLSNLAEQEGDTSTAAKYQKQALEIAPSPEATARLAQLHDKAGEVEEAEAAWFRLASESDDPARIFSTVDRLIALSKNESALAILDRVLVKQPGDWQAIYREGVVLEALGKPAEAARRFRAILDLQHADDEPALPGNNSRKKLGRAATVARSTTAGVPVQNRIYAVEQIRLATKLDVDEDNPGGSGGPNGIWTPSEFGEARMAALGWLETLARKDNKPDAVEQAAREAVEKAGGDPRARWDWYYLQLVLDDDPSIFEAAKDLLEALPADTSAEYAFLMALPAGTNGVSMENPGRVKDVDLALACYRDLRARKPTLDPIPLMTVVRDVLNRAGRADEADKLEREVLIAAEDAEAIEGAIALVARKGDVDGFLALHEKSERLRAKAANATSTGPSVGHPDTFAMLMNQRALLAKAPGDVDRLLDRYLAETRSPEAVARRAKAVASSGSVQSSYRIRVGGRRRRVNIDYPQPNVYHDEGAILVLHTAYELSKKDDRLAGLSASLKGDLDRLPEGEKIYPLLAMSYLAWWDDDKDEAVRLLTQAVGRAKGDVDLRLGLAEILARRGEAAEALELVESVDSLDQKTMQRREVMALRLAVLSGDVERARKAAERLFGLRLDADTQVQLAAQMNQLGMHELAEAVLARARRRAGGNTSALVALMLQYQQAGKTETAFQVAHQILRMSANRQPSPSYNGIIQNEDSARNEAILVFARSGKLKDLIDRAEGQLAVSPHSSQVLQTLAEYYKADGQEDKVKETFNRLARLRPDDGKLRFQVAGRMLAAGDAAGAVENYKFVIDKDPSLFVNSFDEIQAAFWQAEKLEELGKILEELDLKPFGNNSWQVVQVVSSLIQDEKSREPGLNLFRKVWKEFPDARSDLMANVDDDTLKQLPEMYNFLKEVAIPPVGKDSDTWDPVEQLYSWNGDGKVDSMVSRLLEAAKREGQLDALGVEVDRALERSRDWIGGRALRAVILARQGKVDEARAELETLLEKHETMPGTVRIIVGQELDGIKPLKDLELKLYRGAVERDEDNMNSTFQHGPAGRLVTLLHQDGKDAEARELVLKYSKRPSDRNFGNNPASAGYQRVQDGLAFGRQMLELGYPADAVRFFEEILGDAEALAGARQVYGGTDQMTQQILQSLAQALQGLNPKNLAQTLRTLAPPPEPNAPKVVGKPALAPVDLVMIVSPRELDKATLTSLFTEALASAKKAGRREVFDELKSVLARRSEVDPADLSTAIASALEANAEGDSDAITRTLGRLVALVKASPLDPIPAGVRPNARQRLDAAKQLGLWLVARECRKNERNRAGAEILEARALDAAARQADDHWSLAMLRESGQAALDRGDRATAEAHWRRMLRQALATPGVPGSKKPETQAGGPAVSTLERFEKAAQVARLASDHAMHGLSAEVVRESLGAGPPVVPIAMDSRNQSGIPAVSRQQEGGPTQRVEECLHALNASWTAHQMPAKLAYEALRSAVLPDARPDEVFFYPRPLALGDLDKPRSVGAILARRAVEAGMVDDLKRRIESRRDKPIAAIPSRVLAVQVAVILKDDAAVKAILPDLADRLKRDPLKVTAELACHAAIPALDVSGAEGLALSMVESAVKAMAAGPGEVEENGEGVLTPLVVAIARRKFKDHKPDEARATLVAYMERTQQEAIRQGGDYSLYSRKMTLALVAGEFARAGLTADAWDLLGRFADAPSLNEYGSDPEIGPTLGRSIRLLLALPAIERQALLKAWTMPTAGRKSIRLLSTFVPEDRAIPTRFGPMPHVGLDGVASTIGLLIDSAREVGKLDALLLEAKAAASAKVENAQALLILASVASGRSSEVNNLVQAQLDDLKKLKDRPRARPDDDGGRASKVEWRDYLVCRAILANPSTGPQGATFARILIGLAQTNQDWPFLGRVRRDLTIHLAAKAGKLSEPPGADPGLAYWHPVTLQPAYAHAQGGVAPLWAESEGIVSHIAGPQSEYLLFDYPIAGKFEVSADAFIAPWAESRLGYAGLVFEPDQGGAVFPVSHHETVSAPTPFIKRGEFNRTTIQVEPGKLRVLVNGHLFHEESDPGSNSPWLAFYSSQERQTAFRGVTITGAPEIPREVRLVEGDRLEGWACGFYRETQPPRRSVGQLQQRWNLGMRGQATPVTVGDLAQYDWHAEGSAIVGRRADPSAGETSSESRIYYFRPIRDGESIAYEFLHEPGQTMTHPSLDRLTFLLEPSGVKLHWMTDATEDDWTGLKPDNAVEAPEFARLAGPLPLKPGEWNKASIRIDRGVVQLDLNGVRIYEYPLEPANQRIFGFFHDKSRTGAKVRDIVLRGPWPQAVPSSLMARREANPAQADRRARGAMIEERFIQLASGPVLADARKLPPDEKYEALLAYVVRNPDHVAFRLRGDLSPTDPAPLVARYPSGVIEAPALELIATAKALGKLDELADRVEKGKPPLDRIGRPNLAMLALIRAAQGREADAKEALDLLKPLLEKLADDSPEWMRWSDLVAASATLDRPALRPSALALLELMDQKWMNKAQSEWGKIVRPVLARGRRLALEESRRPAVVALIDGSGWAPGSHGTANSRGKGMPPAVWTQADGAFMHTSGHSADLVYLTSPLRGNFEVECELTSFGYRESQISYGALTLALNQDLKSYQLGHFGRTTASKPISPQIKAINPWYAYKLVVKDGNYSAFVDGRKIHNSHLPDEADPWLALASKAEMNGGVRNLKIKGSPVIPGSLNLSAVDNLDAWLGDYYNPLPLWKKQGDEIVGLKPRDPSEPPAPVGPDDDDPTPVEPRDAGKAGSKWETVLKYNRPMLEDGEIAYEFFHEPGKVAVHPSLDRLAFLVEPDGLKIHWMTDAQYDRTGLPPENVAIEPDRRRGPDRPPLKPGEWNKLKLALVGDVVTLTLNEVVVYERPLEPSNHRDFGLFRFADETEARVRNVTYRGQWPKTLPPGLK